MAQPKTTQPRGIEDIIDGATLREATVILCLAGNLQGEYEALERQLNDAASQVGQSLAGSPRVPIAERMEAIRAEMAEHLVAFRFRALDPEAWSDLLAEHPGETADQMFNPKTMFPAAVAACAVEPAMTLEQYGRLTKKLSHGQQEALLNEVWDLNTKAAQRIPFSLLASATVAGHTGES